MRLTPGRAWRPAGCFTLERKVMVPRITKEWRSIDFDFGLKGVDEFTGMSVSDIKKHPKVREHLGVFPDDRCTLWNIETSLKSINEDDDYKGDSVGDDYVLKEMDKLEFRDSPERKKRKVEEKEAFARETRQYKETGELVAGYEEPNGCRNCGSLLRVYRDHDWVQLFCTFGSPTRPPCPHIDAEEIENPTQEDEIAFCKWTDGRHVREWGKCPNWVRAKRVE